MANEKNNANIGFEKQIWDAACVLWGHILSPPFQKNSRQSNWYFEVKQILRH